MGSQRLNTRKTRRIARETGQDVVRAWAHGGYWFDFVTRDHRHGWWHLKDSAWHWDADPCHYTTCPRDPGAPYTAD